MRPEAEIKRTLVHALAGAAKNPNFNDIAAIRALAWVLDIDVSCVKRLSRKSIKMLSQESRKQPVAADHFAI